MVIYPEIEPQLAVETCIPLPMKSEIDRLKYFFNAKNAENFIETKEPMMMRLKN
jgi:hypothetical protein